MKMCPQEPPESPPGSATDGAQSHSGTQADGSRAELVARLFREHNEALLRFLSERLSSHHEAKEVAQEAYVKLLNLDRPWGLSYQRALLFKTASNLAIDRLRLRTRGLRAMQGGLFEELRDNPTPEHIAAVEQQVEHLERLVGEMPAKCRQAFLLHKVQGLEFADVAHRMGLSERMVRDYVMRAIVYCRVGLDAVEQSK
ncbi:RNA polymerase sigma factor [Steroidobacter sp.]|uniref:RNA polymerase sigma factor n=1 Tax=Steroidobacter sp. TaxID=1978227 RepID=UPI001A568E09|nr:sigma-70 family RNA polymerase sigma factor [Steroidobacter sp.]MBL8268727.1 sigma-70 family RNA polymerase sigma factor [Steroidobacter sp.]